MKTRRFSEKMRKNASKGHIEVGQLIREMFAFSKIYQEYPVKRINPEWKSNKHKFDWVILDLKIVVEVMGEQHFKPVTFGGRSKEEAEVKFREQLEIDKRKKQAALQSGFKYAIIAYNEKPTKELIWQRIKGK